MKRCFLALALILAIVTPARAFLNDSDPRDLFTLLEKTPTLVLAKLKKTQNPDPQRAYFVHSLEVEEVLRGSPAKEVQVLQEAIFPGEKGMYPASGSFLAFLAPLPGYTAYAQARSAGVEYRSFGGEEGVLAVSPDARERLLALARSLQAPRPSTGEPSQKRKILLEALAMPELRLRSDALIALAAMDLSHVPLTPAEVDRIALALRSLGLSRDARLAGVQILQKSAEPSALVALKKLSHESDPALKWPAVRALEDLRTPRPSENLVQDFAQASADDRREVVALLAKRKDPVARKFLQKLLEDDTPLPLKKEAILRMGEVEGKIHEDLLLQQLHHPQEEVAALALVTLAKMQSAAGVDRAIAWLDSPSALLSRAAKIALEQSRDPRAVKVYRERFGEKEEVHVH